jgi:hypothetical protein
MRRVPVVIVLVVAGVLVVRHFDSGRSVQAVCHVWDTDGATLHANFTQEGASASSDPLGSLANLASAPAQIGTLMNEMAAVAPSDVEPDFQSLGSALNQVSANEGDALSDPLAALGDDLVAGLSTQQAVDNVNQFLASNCGIPGNGS